MNLKLNTKIKNKIINIFVTMVAALVFLPSLAGAVSFEFKNPVAANDFTELAQTIGTWIFNLAVVAAVIVIVWAGVKMLTARGNPQKFQEGVHALWYAIIGLAVVLIGSGFVELIKSVLDLRN